MNLLNLCLRIPNLGILLYFLFFIVLIPYMLIANSNIQILKYYMPMMVAFAHMLSLSGHKKLFGNLYDLQPKNFVSFVSTNFINLFALFGILWQVITYAQDDSTNIPRAVVYGIILFVIAFPMARQGMKFVLNNVDFYLRKKTEITFEYNWHLLVFGLVYIVFLLGIQAVMLSLVDVSRKKSESDNMKDELNKYKNNRAKLQEEKAKLLKQMNSNRAAKNQAEKNALQAKLRDAEQDEEKINDLINNIKENVNNYSNININNENNLGELENNLDMEVEDNIPNNKGNQGNQNNTKQNMERARELISDISMTDLESFAKSRGISV
jgi:hypothetical protein